MFVDSCESSWLYVCLIRVMVWVGDLVVVVVVMVVAMCVCLCVCAFGSVNLTLNPTLTQLPHPDYCSIHAAVQNGTPNRCGPMSTESVRTRVRTSSNP